MKLTKCSTTLYVAHFTVHNLLAGNKKEDSNSGATYLRIATECVEYYIFM